MRNLFVAGMVLLAIVSSAVFAHDGATGVIKERMESMKGMGSAMKQIKAMINGRADYKAARVKELARSIAEHSGVALNRVFPRGSNAEPSHAKPEIWEDWQAFTDLGAAMEKHAVRLAGNAATASKAKVAYRKLSKTCKSCHRKFRAKRKRR